MIFFDPTIILFLNSIALTNEFIVILTIFLARPLHLLILLSAFYFLLFTQEKNEERMNPLKELIVRIKKNIFVIVSVAVSLIISLILKDLFSIPRPFETLETLTPLFNYGSMDSFPSGHATVYSSLAVSIFFYNKKAGLIFALGAVLVGLGRVMAGVHYFSDIIGGFILGILIPVALFYFVKPKIARFF